MDKRWQDRRPSHEPAALSEIPPAAKPAPERLRVLVVEDHKDAANSLQILMTLLGHEARVAYDGPEGVKAAADWRPDVIISDIGLPGLDGFEVARELRRNPVTAAVVLVALTGYGQPHDRQHALEAGFDHFLTKPADPTALQQLLARHAS
jgi:two-component system, sensor histidine kinase